MVEDDAEFGVLGLRIICFAFRLDEEVWWWILIGV
jgi:hypothetical protein